MAEQDTIAVNHRELRTWVLELTKRVGVTEEDAAVFADALIQAHLRGMDSHGLHFLPVYVQRLELGLIAKRGVVCVLREGPGHALLDGANILGQVAAQRAMEVAVSKAKKNGVAVVGLKNSNHSGILARYTLMAAESDCIGTAMANTPPLMAPWGGVAAYFGTNPVSIAVPAGSEPPLVMDMATSAVARSKILVASRKAERIPEHWARDGRGLPTDDPEEALRGTMAPMSGHKGFALAIMIDILSGLLTGAASGPEVGDLLSYGPSDVQNVGHFFQAIHIDHLVPIGEFERRVARLIRRLRSAPLASGVERMHLPGDHGRETEKKRRQEGIPLGHEIRDEMKRLGEAYGLPWRW
jgi:LDH2 family malate/lactate/ureidoglycolate dehydrogenase